MEHRPGAGAEIKSRPALPGLPPQDPAPGRSMLGSRELREGLEGPMNVVPFAIVGAGWSAGFYVRVARALPGIFRVAGVLTRDAGRAPHASDAWGVPVRSSIDEMLADRPAFVVLAVPRTATPYLLRELSDARVPVLAETPPAPDLDGLAGLADLAASDARIQVAEQYQFQPLHAARLALVASGRLGTVSQAQLE